MSIMKSAVAVLCASLLAALPSLSYAQTTQYYPENTPQACSDRVDNDGDGYIDCYDPDCRYFNFCTPQQGQPQAQPAEPAPPPAPPAPQPYYQPQPTYTPPPPAVASNNGLGQIIAGFIMLPIGIGMAFGSWPLWEIGLRTSGSSVFGTTSGINAPYLAGATILTILGTACVIIGAILVPVGFANHAKWKRSQHRPASISLFGGKVALTPTIGGTVGGPSGSSGSLGLTFSF